MKAYLNQVLFQGSNKLFPQFAGEVPKVNRQGIPVIRHHGEVGEVIPGGGSKKEAKTDPFGIRTRYAGNPKVIEVLDKIEDAFRTQKEDEPFNLSNIDFNPLNGVLEEKNSKINLERLLIAISSQLGETQYPLEGANLEGAHLNRANLRGADLYRAQLAGAKLGGANLRGANLEGANLNRANLNGANLNGANLNGANLRGANLEGADLIGADLNRANLRRAYLGGADLRRAYLTGAYLEGADLREACAFDNATTLRGLELKKYLQKVGAIIDSSTRFE